MNWFSEKWQFSGYFGIAGRIRSISLTHLKDKASRGSGHVNYFSSTICEELIALMGERDLNEIITRIKKKRNIIQYQLILHLTIHTLIN